MHSSKFENTELPTLGEALSELEASPQFSLLKAIICEGISLAGSERCTEITIALTTKHEAT